MVSRLGHAVNKAVLVSIPLVFSDARPRGCRVIGLELTGLWLESGDLWRIAFHDTERPPGAVFVPFTQIAYLVEAPPVAAPPPSARTEPPTRLVPPKTKGPTAQGGGSRKRG